MRKTSFALLVVAALLTMPGCRSWDGTVSSLFNPQTVAVTGVTDADLKQYETIGVEFAKYSAADTSLTPELKQKDIDLLAAWRTTGSTIETYAEIAPRYVAYVNQNPKLNRTSKSVRMDNVASWKMVLEARYPKKH